MRGINLKTGLVAAAVVLVLLVGAGVAYANGSGDDGSGQANGPGMDKAKSVALDQVNGRVTGTEFQDEEGYYEVEVTKDDGSQVDVHLDKNFQVINAQSDHEGAENGDAQDKGGDESEE